MTIPATASGGYEAVTTEVDLIAGTGAGTTVEITVEDTSANAVLIHVPKLHRDGDFALVDIGQTVDFRLGTDDISSVLAKSVTGTSSVKFAFVAKGVRG